VLGSLAVSAGVFKSDLDGAKKTVGQHSRALDQAQEDITVLKTQAADTRDLLREIRDDVKELRRGNK
jgi:hypothetical protein